MEKKLLNVKEAAEMLGIKESTLYIWAERRQNGLPSYKVGRCRRFDAEEILEWAKRGK